MDIATIRRKAEQQRGVIARYQLVALADEQYLADNFLRTCAFDCLERGVYRIVGGATLPIQPAIAAVLRARPGATLTGPVVLGHLNVDGFTDSEHFEVLLAPGRRLRGVSFTHRVDPDPHRSVARLGDARLANPVDALIDTAGFVDLVGERQVRLAYDWMRWHDLVTAEKVARRIRELRGLAPGAAVLHDLLEAGGGGRVESEGERQLGALLRCFEPAPEPQVYVTPKRRVDWFFRLLRIVVEYLGSVDHATAAGRAADGQRDDELARAGIEVIYVVHADLAQPQALLGRIAGVLALRAQELGVAAPVLSRPLPA